MVLWGVFFLQPPCFLHGTILQGGFGPASIHPPSLSGLPVFFLIKKPTKLASPPPHLKASHLQSSHEVAREGEGEILPSVLSLIREIEPLHHKLHTQQHKGSEHPSICAFTKNAHMCRHMPG